MTEAPPSTLSANNEMPESSCITSRTSLDLNAIDSNVALIIASRPESRVSPNIAPLACMSQYGVPNPAKAGTTTTEESGFFFASREAISEVELRSSIISMPFCNHCTAAPAIKTLPSKA